MKPALAFAAGLAVALCVAAAPFSSSAPSGDAVLVDAGNSGEMQIVPPPNNGYGLRIPAVNIFQPGSRNDYISWTVQLADAGGVQYQLGLDNTSGSRNLWMNVAYEDGGNPQTECFFDFVNLAWSCNALVATNYIKTSQVAMSAGNGVIETENSGQTIALRGGQTAGSGPSIGVILTTYWNYTAADDLVQVINNFGGTPVVESHIDGIGGYRVSSTGAITPGAESGSTMPYTCASEYRGAMVTLLGNGTSTNDKQCVCVNAAGTYKWISRDLVTGTITATGNTTTCN